MPHKKMLLHEPPIRWFIRGQGQGLGSSYTGNSSSKNYVRKQVSDNIHSAFTFNTQYIQHTSYIHTSYIIHTYNIHTTYIQHTCMYDVCMQYVYAYAYTYTYTYTLILILIEHYLFISISIPLYLFLNPYPQPLPFPQSPSTSTSKP